MTQKTLSIAIQCTRFSSEGIQNTLRLDFKTMGDHSILLRKVIRHEIEALGLWKQQRIQISIRKRLIKGACQNFQA